MRKVNRLMFKAVAVLLTFVLITTCVISGTLAKYTVSKDRSVEVKLEKFGVEVTVSVPQKTTLEQQGVVITYPEVGSDKVKAGVYEVTITNLPIGPGDDYRNLVRFDFDGNANVLVKISLATTIEYKDKNGNDIDFYIPKEAGIFQSARYYCPIGFWCAGYDANGEVEGLSMGDPGKNSTSKTGEQSATSRSNNVATNLKTYFDFDEKSNNVVSKTFSPDENNGEILFHIKSDNELTTSKDETTADLNAFVMGYWWPFDNKYPKNRKTATGTITSFDEVSTYIAQNYEDAYFNITYIVTVTQIAAAT